MVSSSAWQRLCVSLDSRPSPSIGALQHHSSTASSTIIIILLLHCVSALFALACCALAHVFLNICHHSSAHALLLIDSTHAPWQISDQGKTGQFLPCFSEVIEEASPDISRRNERAGQSIDPSFHIHSSTLPAMSCHDHPSPINRALSFTLIDYLEKYRQLRQRHLQEELVWKHVLVYLKKIHILLHFIYLLL